MGIAIDRLFSRLTRWPGLLGLWPRRLGSEEPGRRCFASVHHITVGVFVFWFLQIGSDKCMTSIPPFSSGGNFPFILSCISVASASFSTSSWLNHLYKDHRNHDHNHYYDDEWEQEVLTHVSTTTTWEPGSELGLRQAMEVMSKCSITASSCSSSWWIVSMMTKWFIFWWLWLCGSEEARGGGRASEKRDQRVWTGEKAEWANKMKMKWIRVTNGLTKTMRIDRDNYKDKGNEARQRQKHCKRHPG